MVKRRWGVKNNFSQSRSGIEGLRNLGIQELGNWGIEDFRCRYLVVDDIWIPLGESLLIETFNPLWNRVMDGFGNHDPGKGRYNQARSAWDVVHPGRQWAFRCAEKAKKPQDYLREVADFLDKLAQNV
jgi:hypothetical protein